LALDNASQQDSKEETNDEKSEDLPEIVTLQMCDKEALARQEKAKHSEYDRDIGIFPDPQKVERTEAKAKRLHEMVQHVVHRVNWSDVFNAKLVPNETKWKFNPKNTKKVESDLFGRGKDAYTIELLSPSESAKLIELAEIYGFVDCGYPKNYRSNTRTITQDPRFVDELYERIKLCCQQTYEVSTSAGDQIWDVCGLNERLRWCKYVKGQRFGRHCDSRFTRSSTEKSFYTVNVYLNDGTKEFKGGRTRFYKGSRMQLKVSSKVTARPGLALIFNQYPDQLYHDGEELADGVKYIMRTDIMYRLRQEPQESEDK